MSDNKWTAVAAVASAVSGIACGMFGRRSQETRTPELHKRVALLERRLDEMEEKAKAER